MCALHMKRTKGRGKFPEKGNLRGISVVLAEMRLHGQKKFQKKSRNMGIRRCSQVGKRKAAWECPRRRGQGGRPQSPLVAPAGAVPPATIKIKKHGCALRRFPKGDRRLRLFSLPFGRLRRGEISCLRERAAMSARSAAWSRPFGATMCK